MFVKWRASWKPQHPEKSKQVEFVIKGAQSHEVQISGPEKGVITKGVFSPEKSLDPGQSRKIRFSKFPGSGLKKI